MKHVAGVPKMDSIYVGEVQLDLHAVPDIHMLVRFGYAESKTGRRFGSSTKLGGWSPATLQALSAFIDALEEDIANDCFDGASTSPGGEGTSSSTSDGVPGL